MLLAPRCWQARACECASPSCLWFHQVFLAHMLGRGCRLCSCHGLPAWGRQRSEGYRREGGGTEGTHAAYGCSSAPLGPPRTKTGAGCLHPPCLVIVSLHQQQVCVVCVLAASGPLQPLGPACCNQGSGPDVSLARAWPDGVAPTGRPPLPEREEDVGFSGTEGIKGLMPAAGMLTAGVLGCAQRGMAGRTRLRLHSMPHARLGQEGLGRPRFWHAAVAGSKATARTHRLCQLC